MTHNFTVVQPPADLSVTSSVAGIPFVGNDLTFTLHVSNAGPEWAAGATVGDQLPAGSVYASAVTSQGSCSRRREP